MLTYIEENLRINDDVLLADGQAKKVFTVASSVSIIVAASTPAFPKEDDKAENKK